VFSLSLVAGLGIPSSTLASWVARGLVDRIGPGVFRIGGAPTTWRGDAVASALWSHGHVSHGSALAMRGLDGSRRTRPIDVLVPRWARTHTGIPFARVHETRDLRGVDMDIVGGIPTTSTARSLIDACATMHPFAVGLALDDACLRDANALDSIHRRYRELRRRGRRGIALMGRLLAERMGGKGFSKQGFEAHAVRLARAIGLPEPVKQMQVVSGAFTAYVDLGWPEIRYGWECQSMQHHLNKRAHEWDKARRRKLKLLGYELEELTYDQVTVDKHVTGPELLQLYHLRCTEIARTGGSHGDISP
jgi:hypothetical protein